MELKEAYDFIKSECKDVPKEELIDDQEFSIDFVRNNYDIGYNNIMTVISAYTRYYYDRIHDLVKEPKKEKELTYAEKQWSGE